MDLLQLPKRWHDNNFYLIKRYLLAFSFLAQSCSSNDSFVSRLRSSKIISSFLRIVLHRLQLFLSYLVGLRLSSSFVSLMCSSKILFNSLRFALYRLAEVLLSYSLFILNQLSDSLLFFSMAPLSTFHELYTPRSIPQSDSLFISSSH